MKKLHLGLFFAFGCLDFANSIDFRANSCKDLNAYHVSFASPKCSYNPNVLSSVPDIVLRNQKPLEIHYVTTEDGYILTLFRITNKGGQPVYLQHGILTNSVIWVDKEANQSLAYYLHNLGHDVWLGNVRGTTYSKKHLNYTIYDKPFWEYNLDSISEYDVSASLKFIGNVTGKGGEIVYIGHSMGTTISFMYAISKPEEAKSLLKGIISLSPVCYVNSTSLIPSGLENLADPIRALLKLLGINGFFKYEKILHKVVVTVCNVLPQACSLLNTIFYGKSEPYQFPPEYLLLYYSNWPVGVSRDQLIQYMQIAKSRNFSKFDYGEKENLELYGQSTPPLYDLKKFTLPYYAFYGTNDGVTPEANVRRFFDQVGSERKKLIPTFPEENVAYDHITFDYGKNIDNQLYPRLKNAIDDFNKQ